MTIQNMLQVEQLEIRSKSDNQLHKMNEASRHSGRNKPYEASHPHHKHHRRLRAAPQPQPEPEIEIETYHTPEVETPASNPNDPFEKHFLAAAAFHALPQPSVDTKRSSSFRNDKQRPSVTLREAELNNSGAFSSSPNLLFPKDDISVDNKSSQDQRDLRRVRSFKSTSKGVVNRGDSFRKRNSSRNVASGSMSDSPRLPTAPSHTTEFVCTPKTEEPQASYFRVQVLGAPGCGKTSITNQFMSSDYANAYDSMNVDEVERTITIQLDGEEATMEFIDVLPEEDSEDHEIDLTSDAYVVVYSVIDRTTFDAAVQSLYKLRHVYGIDRPIILVGNKIDLVRKRKVKRNDVLSICRTYDCFHFETSAALNHNVDDILVTLLKQIRYKLDPERYTMPDYTLPEKDEEEKGGFLTKLYRRLSRKGRPKSKK